MSKVLIVDDEELTCRALCSIVSGVPGFEVAGCVGSGEEAIKFCNNNDVHLVFMDVALPGMTGIEAAAGISRIIPSARIYIISVLSGFEIIRKALSSRIQGYLVKPVSFSEIRSFLESFQKEHEEDMKFSSRILECIYRKQYREMMDEIPNVVDRVFQESHGNTEVTQDRFLLIINQIFRELNEYVVESRTFTVKTLEDRFPINRVFAREEISWVFWLTDVMNTVYWEQVVAKHDFLKNVQEYIDSEIKNDISLGSICEACNISQSYLSKLFRRYFGISVMDYIHLRRLAGAKMYIALTDYTMTQIGHHTGYNDGSYFSKIFKKYEGMTPKQYKAKYCVKDKERIGRHE